MFAGLARLKEVMTQLRQHCPWNAKQTHRSLAPFLIEETAEVVEAIESGSETDLKEELGDLLLQVFFHAEIAEEANQFTLDQIAQGIADKMVQRHPHVFAEAEVPADMEQSWESAKQSEKKRQSCLAGIPNDLDPVSRAQKVIYRAQVNQLDLRLPNNQLTTQEVGAELIRLVACAQASGVDAAQASREAIRELEAEILIAERKAKGAVH